MSGQNRPVQVFPRHPIQCTLQCSQIEWSIEGARIIQKVLHDVFEGLGVDMVLLAP